MEATSNRPRLTRERWPFGLSTSLRAGKLRAFAAMKYSAMTPDFPSPRRMACHEQVSLRTRRAVSPRMACHEQVSLRTRRAVSPRMACHEQVSLRTRRMAERAGFGPAEKQPKQWDSRLKPPLCPLIGPLESGSCSHSEARLDTEVLPADLREVVDAWPELPAGLKSAVLALVSMLTAPWLRVVPPE